MKGQKKKSEKETYVRKFKTGDKVTVKPYDWYRSWYITEYLDGEYAIVYNNTACFHFRKEMAEYCGKECTIYDVKEGQLINSTDYTEYYLSYDGAQIPYAFYECFLQ